MFSAKSHYKRVQEYKEGLAREAKLRQKSSKSGIGEERIKDMEAALNGIEGYKKGWDSEIQNRKAAMTGLFTDHVDGLFGANVDQTYGKKIKKREVNLFFY